MDYETLTAITPYVTLTVTLLVGVIGWGVRLLIQDTARHLEELRREFGLRLSRIERGLEQLEAARLTDHKEAYDRFVSKEWFFRTLGRTEHTLRRLSERIQRLADRRYGRTQRKTG